tara:strand:+ start:3510 stop:4247 length:738 start_codon:yes stop_codon:yes gene_type:complete
MGEEQGDAGWGDSNSSDGWGSAAAAPSDGSSYTGGDFFQSNYDSPNSAADASKGYPAPSSFTPPPQQSFSQPNLGNVYNGNAGGGSTSFEDEEPLLDELGINFSHIKSKTVAVLNPFAKVDPLLMVDADMAGPLIFCLALGVFYMMSGKLHFDYIYGLGGLGCTALFGLLNLMSERGINLYNTISVFGYALLPMTILAGVAVVYPLNGLTGYSANNYTYLHAHLHAYIHAQDHIFKFLSPCEDLA